MSNGWRTPVVFEEALKNRALASGSFVQPGDSMFVVNRSGRRVANEKRNYNDRTRVHQTYDPNTGDFPNLLTFYIYDRRVAEAYAGNYPLPRAGKDEDFGRGDFDYDRQWSPWFGPMREDTAWAANDLPNDTLYPLQADGPYHCIILAPGFLDTNGGPRINERAQVLHATGEPMPMGNWPLSDDQLELVRRWIAEGANRN